MIHSSRLDASTMTTFYYRVSLLFLILRTLVMLLTSSHVYVASRKPLEILRAVPMSSWSTSVWDSLFNNHISQTISGSISVKQVQRFTNEILNIENALSGHKFFFLRRGIILAVKFWGYELCNPVKICLPFQMAGTMITYELVMLSEVRHSDNTKFCDGGHRLYWAGKNAALP